MNKSFTELLKENLSKKKIQQGTIIDGTVLDINEECVIVDVGLKSEGWIPVQQFLDNNNNIEIKIGSTIKVIVEDIDDGTGVTKISREKARRVQGLLKLENAYNKKEIIKGLITNKVKGGFTVDVKSVKAFLPGSLVSNKPMYDTTNLEGCELEFRVIKIDKLRSNIVLSRKAVLDTKTTIEKNELLSKIKEKQILQGTVKNITNYGAFIDLGGLDGLLHITDITWKKIKHPNEILKIGQELEVEILRFDKNTNRVSLGLKQLKKDPWVNILSKYTKGTKHKGIVTSISNYGCFVEIENGIEGLVHISEIDWVNKTTKTDKVVSLGMEVDVMIINIDEKRRRISLGMKQCKNNPWEDFAVKYKKGEKINCKIKSITDFGIFVGLDGNIDGLVHLSDLTWDETKQQTEIKKYTRGDMLETVILTIDPKKERISLGVKQLKTDPYIEYIAQNPKGSIVKCIVEDVTEKTILVKLTDSLFSHIKKAELNTSNTKKIEKNDSVEVKIIAIDKKNRLLNLSMKAKEKQEEKNILKQLNKESKKINPTLGELIQKQIVKKNEDN